MTRSVREVEAIYDELVPVAGGPEAKAVTPGGAGSELAGRRLVHLATTDMSLALLLGPQLRAFADAGMEVIGASAPGPYTVSWRRGVSGMSRCSMRHGPTRSDRTCRPWPSWSACSGGCGRTSCTLTTRNQGCTGGWRPVWPGCRSWSTPCTVSTPRPQTRPSAGRFVYALERGVSVCSQAELIQNEEDLETLARLRVPARKLVLLGNGVDLERFRPRPDLAAAARRSMGVADGKVLVGLVGRLVWEKGFAELFEAARRLRHTNPEVAIVVIGPGDPAKSNALSGDDVRTAEEIGNVSFLGERKDVEELYPGMDLFVLPSYREGFPRSAMEAAACGVPVVATDIRGCRQVVDDGITGLLVPVRDAVALADALGTLAQRPGAAADHERGSRDAGPSGIRRPEGDRDHPRRLPTPLGASRRGPAPVALGGMRERGMPRRPR